MRKVKMLQQMAGERFVWNVGEEVTLPAEKAERLVKAGFAEYADVKKGKEKESAS